MAYPSHPDDQIGRGESHEANIPLQYKDLGEDPMLACPVESCGSHRTRITDVFVGFGPENPHRHRSVDTKTGYTKNLPLMSSIPSSPGYTHVVTLAGLCLDCSRTFVIDFVNLDHGDSGDIRLNFTSVGYRSKSWPVSI